MTKLMRGAAALAALTAVYLGSACKDSTGAGGITCNAADPVCPPSNLPAGFSGGSGAPTISPTSPSGTSVSTAASNLVVTGTTSATTSGYWLLVVGSTLRSAGVLAVLAGDYEAEIPLFCGQQDLVLTFSNSSGRSYFFATVTLTDCTTPSFRVQLTWDTGPSSDIDLHLIRPGGSFRTSNDCYYGNCTVTGGLEWGATGPAGNPLLDVDDTEGWGPENITIATGAETGQYRVVVHNYDGSLSTRATVKVFFNDVEATRYTSQVLDTPNDYWSVATVNVLTRTVTAVNTYSSTPPSAPGMPAGIAGGLK